MAIKTQAQLTTLISTNITDALNKQNTAAKAREIWNDTNDTMFGTFVPITNSPSDVNLNNKNLSNVLSYNKLIITPPATTATLTVADNSSLITSGAFSTTITSTALTAVTLPTTGTLYGTKALSITSAQLFNSLTDPNGTGVVVFGTSPTFTTSIITPLIIGGSSATQTLTYKTTTGVGTTGADHIFQSGNNGSTEIMRMFNNGNIAIGTTTADLYSQGFDNLFTLTSTGNSVFLVASGTEGTEASIDFGSPTIRRAGIASVNGSHLTFNTNTNNSGTPVAEKMRITATGDIGIGITIPLGKLHVEQTLRSTGTLKGFIYLGAANTNQTLSTEIPSATWFTQGRQWATGAIATQREFLITQPTYSFVGASTITNAATFAIEGAPVASTNATLTNSYALWIQSGTSKFDGNISIVDFNIILGTTTGTKIGTSTSQKLSLWNATPIIQPTTAVTAATFVANTSLIANDTATFDGYTIGQVVKALRNIGVLA